MNKHAVTSFTLKVVAIIGMTCNHVANIFAAQLPAWLTVGLCSLGGLTFPIMAFLLCEGYRYTSNVKKYALRLGGFALVAQIPYSLLWGATGNVLVTLLIGLGILWADEHLRNRGAFGAVLVGGVVLSAWCDWGVIGTLMIFLFARLQSQGSRRAIGTTMLVAAISLGLPALGDIGEALSGMETVNSNALLASMEAGAQASGHGAAFTVGAAGLLIESLGSLGYATIGFGGATLLMLHYNGKRGKPLKWFFYVYYPAHLMILWAIATFVV